MPRKPPLQIPPPPHNQLPPNRPPHNQLPPKPLPVFQLRGSVGRPMTNAERQAEFRHRHPDYNRQYKARMRAAVLALRAAREAVKVEQAALAWAEQLLAPQQLCLPAPVVTPVIPGLNAIDAVRAPALSSIHS